jgi:hypothetical protein
MKSRLRERAAQDYLRNMRFLMPVVMCLAVIALGCTESETTSSNAQTNSVSDNPLDAPAEYLGALHKGHQKSIATTDIASLTRAIQMFQVEEGRNPKDLNELVTSGTMPRLPEAPRGMELAYDPATGNVSLVAAQ